jgi:hypothetical protein
MEVVGLQDTKATAVVHIIQTAIFFFILSLLVYYEIFSLVSLFTSLSFLISFSEIHYNTKIALCEGM